MPRVKLVEQQEYEFHYSLILQPRDMNYAGHLGNDALVSLFGAARAHMFHSLGLSEQNLGDGQTGILMSDLTVNYKAEAFMFDEISIDTHVGEFLPKGFRAFHKATRGNTIIALAETGIVAFNYETRKTVPVPEIFRALMQRRCRTEVSCPDSADH